MNGERKPGDSLFYFRIDLRGFGEKSISKMKYSSFSQLFFTKHELYILLNTNLLVYFQLSTMLCFILVIRLPKVNPF